MREWLGLQMVKWLVTEPDNGREVFFDINDPLSGDEQELIRKRRSAIKCQAREPSKHQYSFM